MDIGKSFSYVFADDRWVTKILIAAGILVAGIVLCWLLLIPLIIAALLLGGYGVEIMRRVMNGDPQPLPEWDNWQAFLMDGLRLAAISIVYSLPIIVISVCVGGVIGIIGSDSSGQMSDFGALLSWGLNCLSFLWSLVVYLLLPAAVAHYIVSGQLNSAFRFGDIIQFVRANIKTYLIVLVLTYGVYLLAGLVGSLLCGIGLLFTYPYAIMVISHLWGQGYRETQGVAGTPVVA